MTERDPWGAALAAACGGAAGALPPPVPRHPVGPPGTLEFPMPPEGAGVGADPCWVEPVMNVCPDWAARAPTSDTAPAPPPKTDPAAPPAEKEELARCASL